MNKQENKRYLLSLIALLIGGFIIAYAVIGYLLSSGLSHVALTPLWHILLSLALTAVPAGNYAGFVFFGTRIKELKTKQAVLFVVLFPLVLAFVTAAGVVLILPTAVSAAIQIFRG